MPRLLAILLFLLATRLLQTDLVWVEEGYPTAAAIQMLDGKALYRDVWFDKPPLFPALYLLWGAHIGIPLRLAGALFVFACCLMLYKFARELWGENEGIAAAAMLAFFLTFGIPAAVMALAPDLLMILPHAAAVYLAWRGRAFWCGVMAGVAMLVNTKAVFVLAACLLWQWRAALPMIAGFALPNLACAGWLALTGSLTAYWEQVWAWGFLYSRETFVRNPLLEGLTRTANWAGFQAALVAGAAWVAWHERRRQFVLWIAIAAIGVAAGWRFFPRYYFLLLVPFCLLAARAITSSPKWVRFAILALLAIPLVRFGPRLVRHSDWSDTAMMDDSRSIAKWIDIRHQPGDTLLVWGYRPDIFAFTGMRAGSRFLDSQPLTGVIADRHLTSSEVVAPELAARNRHQLSTLAPTFVIDGLGPYNPTLAITQYPDLTAWLSNYRIIAKTKGAVLYERQR